MTEEQKYEQVLRCAIHELIGFIAGCDLSESQKKLVMNLPAVQKVCESVYIISTFDNVMKLKDE